MSIPIPHVPLPSPWAFFGGPKRCLSRAIINLLVCIPFFGFSNLRKLSRPWTLSTYVWVTVMFGQTKKKCAELAFVKNTERWVSLPRIQIGNFGDFRKDPTWNTAERECVQLFGMNTLLLYERMKDGVKKNNTMWGGTVASFLVSTAFCHKSVSYCGNHLLA